MKPATTSRHGTTDARTILALGKARGNRAQAAAIAAGRGRGWNETHERIRAAAVPAEGTASSALDDGVGAIDLLRSVRQQELLSRLPGLRRIPFGTKLATTSGGFSAAWLGEGKANPLSQATFTEVSPNLPRLKLAAGAAFSEELFELSTLDTESIVFGEMVSKCTEAADLSAFDASAAVTAERPAALNYGSPAFASSGSTAAALDTDLGKLVESLVAAGSTLEFAHWIMHPLTASFLARLKNSNGDSAHPQMSVVGGQMLGLPALVSASLVHGASPSIGSITLIDGSRVWLAEAPEMRLRASRVATVELSDSPSGDSLTPTAANTTSMFQTHGVLVQAVRYMNFAIASANFCATLNGLDVS